VIGKHELSDLEDKKLFEKRNGILINKINHLSIVDSSKSRYFYLIYVCKLARLFNSMGFLCHQHIFPVLMATSFATLLRTVVNVDGD
jgi:hypothetical protein